MGSERLYRREPVGFRPAPGPLDCFGSLPPLPAAPARAGLWRAPSPRPAPGDETMTVEVTRPPGPRRGTVVLAPPWKLAALSHLSRWVGSLASAGLEVWTLVPPRHLHRSAPGTRSGEGFMSPDLGVLHAAFEQLVLELRVLAAMARGRREPVGMVGLSLGGLATALAATAPERLDFAALVAPPVDLASLVHSTPIGRRYLDLARRAGAPLPASEEIAFHLEGFRPDRRTPTASRILVAAGAHDQVASPEAAVALARAWGVAPLVYPRGHLTLLFGCGALRRDVAAFAGAARPDAAVLQLGPAGA